MHLLGAIRFMKYLFMMNVRDYNRNQLINSGNVVKY